MKKIFQITVCRKQKYKSLLVKRKTAKGAIVYEISEYYVQVMCLKMLSCTLAITNYLNANTTKQRAYGNIYQDKLSECHLIILIFKIARDIIIAYQNIRRRNCALKKITSIITLAIFIMTCLVVLVACDDGTNPDDPILGWYAGADGSLYHFSIKDGKLMYSFENSDSYIEVHKNINGQYIVPLKYEASDGESDKNKEYVVYKTYNLNSTSYTEKRLSEQNDFSDGRWVYRYFAPTDKTFEEARQEFNAYNPWLTSDPALGWYSNSDKGFLHIYIAYGHLSWDYNDESKCRYLDTADSADDGAPMYFYENTHTFRFENNEPNKKITLIENTDVGQTTYEYSYCATFNTPFELLNRTSDN